MTGISSEIYAGWSLLATVTGFDHGKALEVPAPLLLEPDTPGRKRMIVTGAIEISDPADSPRRFLLKAYAIETEAHGSGLHDSFHLGDRGRQCASPADAAEPPLVVDRDRPLP